MSARRELPEIPESALRDHGSAQRVERVWRRLESDLGARRGPAVQMLFWAPAALAIAFGCGMAVGARWMHSESVPESSVGPEPAGAPRVETQERALPAPVDSAASRVERQPHRARVMPPPAVEPQAAVEVPMAAPLPATAAPPEWAELANAGDFKAAREKLDVQGGFDAALERASAEQLMTLVDIARYGGERERAMQALRRVVERHRGDPNAPLAAMTLANMLEKAGDREGAARAYAAYRDLSPQGDFAEDALAREVEVAVQRGDEALARKLAAQHEKDFPDGRLLSSIREQLAKLPAADAGAGAEAAAPGDPAAQSSEAPSSDPPR